MPMSHRHNRYARKNSPDSGTFSIDYLAFREADTKHTRRIMRVRVFMPVWGILLATNKLWFVCFWFLTIHSDATNELRLIFVAFVKWIFVTCVPKIHIYWNITADSFVCQFFFLCVFLAHWTIRMAFDGLKKSYRNHGFSSKMYLSLNLVILSQFSSELRTWMAAIHTRNACSIWL